MRAFILFILLVFLGAIPLRADNDQWRVVSPVAYSQVKSGELFMAVAFNKELNLRQNSVEIFLDGYLVTSNIKITEGKITMLYLLPLKPGKHTLEVQANAYKYGWLEPLKWAFHVAGATGPEGSPIDSGVAPKSKTHFELTGNISVQYRRYLLSGDSEAVHQRQELPYTQTLSVNTVAKVSKVSFPIQYYNTSDEHNYQPALQSRNYFQVGAEAKWFDVRYGDMNPNFDMLILPGIRVHGLKVAIKIKRTQLQVIDGYLQRPVNGTIQKYTVGIPPPSLRFDSTYLQPGVYKRRISAARLSFGNKAEGSAIGISVMKAKDDIFSIDYGANPMDNLVMGYDQAVVTSGSRMKFTGGIAYSFITDDISKGALEKKTVDSIYGTDLPVDPAKYKRFIIVNETTHKPDKQSAAGYINSTFRSRSSNHTLMIEYRYIGGAYRSLANPFLRNDLRGGTIQDQAYFLKRKIALMLRYNIQISNLSGTQFTFINSHLGSGSLLLMPSRKLPQLSIFYNFQWRISPPAVTTLAMANDQLNAYGANLSYTFKALKSYHGISLQYSENKRTDKIYSINNSGVRNFNASLDESITGLNLTLSLQYGKMIYTESSGSTYPLYDMYSGRLVYRWKKLKSDFGVSAYMNHFFDTPLSAASDRNTYSFVYSGRFVKNMVIDLEGGIAPFLDAQNEALSYNENYFMVRVSYDLNVR